MFCSVPKNLVHASTVKMAARFVVIQCKILHSESTPGVPLMQNRAQSTIRNRANSTNQQRSSWRKQWREGNQFSYEHCHNTAVKQSFKVDWTIPQRGCVNQRHSKKIFHDLFHVSLVKRRFMHGRVSFAIVLNYPTTFMQNFINMVCIEWMKFWRRIYKEFVRETVYPSGKISLKCIHV